MSDLLIRQGGLRFQWDRAHHVHIEDADGGAVGFLFVGRPTHARAQLDDVHDAIDAYCHERGLRPADKEIKG